MPPPSTERHEARRKKKNFYAALKKQEDTKLQELADKYRDRARERRDGANPDYQAMDAVGGSGSNAYRAVAPDLKSGLDAAERRRQMIQESKFLGGDMEHTHLVKGLDYALLQKVRSEIVVKEHEQEIEMEKLVEEAIVEKEKEDEKPKQNDEPEYKTVMGRNILNTLQFYRSRRIERNELFAPGRMAYVIELEDDNAETDIPTTLIRSKADVPLSHDDVQTLTTNDIVINKLAQILSYLRQGGRGKKNKRRDKDKPLMLKEMDFDDKFENDIRSGNATVASGLHNVTTSNDDNRSKRRETFARPREQNLSIYDDVGDYRATRNNEHHHNHHNDDYRNDKFGKHNNRNDAGEHSRKSRNYFNKSSEQEERENGSVTRKYNSLLILSLLLHIIIYLKYI